MSANLLLVHGGGPTAVINASLYGAICQAKKEKNVNRIYAAIGGTGGLLKGNIKDLTDEPEESLRLLLQTPGSAIGTSRDELDDEHYKAMLPIFEQYNIKYVLMNGGNGTMDTCGKIYKACEGTDIKVMGIPKTMDNDISVTDHSPGFASAARYIAQSVAELCADVKGLPIHVVVVETCGRNAGWITASAALAKESGVDGPDLIYLPERPFDEEQYIEDIKNLLKKKTGIVVVCSEGLTDKNGENIVKPIYKSGRSTYFGDVSAHLAMLVIKHLGYKARNEKPGLIGRASMEHVSSIDREEAILVGKKAVEACVAGESGKMVALIRDEGSEYSIHTELIDIEDVMLYEKKLPDRFINEQGNGVTDEFIEWCKPLLGAKLPKLVSFR